MHKDKNQEDLVSRLELISNRYTFAMQFFSEIGKKEKAKYRAQDNNRLNDIRQHPEYEAAFTEAAPLISVIIPTYSRSEIVIERTIPSILAQTYQNWELIIVGDKMDEEHATRLAEIKHPKIRFINLTQRGRYPTEKGPRWYVAGIKPINFGMRIAKGRWIAHLDDDDEFMPNHLESLHALAQKSKAEWVHARVRFIEESGNEIGWVGSPIPAEGEIARISSIYHGHLKTFRYNPNCWRYFCPGDWDLWERFLSMGIRHAHLPKITATHHGGISRVDEAISPPPAARIIAPDQSVTPSGQHSAPPSPPNFARTLEVQYSPILQAPLTPTVLRICRNHLRRLICKAPVIGKILRALPRKPPQTICFVSATRKSEEAFWKEAPLGQSLQRLQDTEYISVLIRYDNKDGLPAVYNAALATARDSDIIVFLHDDVWLNDVNLIEKLRFSLSKFDLIGVAGNKRRKDKQPAWLFSELARGQFIWDWANLSGTIFHGTPNQFSLMEYGPGPTECKLLDGVFLAVRTSSAIQTNLLFDPTFSFNFYDMDYCRNATRRGLTLSTWPIDLIHQSAGNFGSPGWQSAYASYLDKWKN